MKQKKYEKPDFLQQFDITQEKYEKWLDNKASTHYTRDKEFCKKCKKVVKAKEEYKIAIHSAVIQSNGLDEYTGKILDWNAINTFDGVKIPNLPTIDQFDRQTICDRLSFVICSWTVNDMKNDLEYDEFISLCKTIVENPNRARTLEEIGKEINQRVGKKDIRKPNFSKIKKSHVNIPLKEYIEK